MKIMQKAASGFVAGAAILWEILIIFVRQLDGAGLAGMEIVALRVYGSAAVLDMGCIASLEELRWC